MSSMSLPRVGAVLLAALLIVSAMPVQATHGGAKFDITSLGETTVLADSSLKTFGLTVKNTAAADTVDKIVITIPSANGVFEPLRWTVATASGWGIGAGPTSADADGNADTLTLTPMAGGLAPGASLPITLEFQLNAPDDGTPPAETAADLDGTTVVVRVVASVAAATHGEDSFSFAFEKASFRFTNPAAVTLPNEVATEVRSLVMDAPPRENVKISIVSADTSIATVSTAELEFTPTNWKVPQPVTIAAQSDDLDADAGRQTTVTASFVSGASFATAAAQTLTVNVADDDTAGIVVVQRDPADAADDGATVVYEGGPGDKLRIRLATKPSVTTTVTLSVDVANQVTIEPATLTFTPTNGLTAQTVTLTAVDDTVAEVLSTSVTVSAAVHATERAPEYASVTPWAQSIPVIDNEGAGMTLVETGGQTTVSEAAGARTDTFTVVLNREPHKSVVVTAVAAQAGQTTPEITVLPAQVIFTATNWNVPQTFTVTAIDDQIPELTEIATVAVAIDKALSSGEYHLVPAQTVTVSIMDDDQAGFAIVETGGSTVTTEDGGSDTVTVQLTKKPSSNVVIQATTSNTDEVLISGPASGLMTFTPDNWATPQVVTLTGQNDDVADGHKDVDVSFAVVVASSDTNWKPLAAQTIKVTNKDNEAVVMARPMTVSVLEGESVNYALSLTIKPINDVTVTITPGGGLKTSPGSVVFTPANWDTPRTIAVTVPDDAIAEGNRTVSIKHSVLGQGNYQGAVGETLTVKVEEDDTIDIAAQNEALQRTLKVSRADNRNTITWDISVVVGAPQGIQLWRADSPFFIVATADNGTAPYRLGKYTDDGGSSSSRYVISVFYGDDAESGFHTLGKASLDQVAGYLGQSEADLEKVGQSVPEADDNTLLIVGTIIGLLVVVAIIVVIVILARRKKDDEGWESDWGDEPKPAVEQEDSKDAPWKASGWQVEPDRPTTSRADADTWSDEPVVAEDAGWDADEATEEFAWPEHEDVPLKTFHLTCPQCSHDFSVQGHKPLETECPNCGVTGVLR